MERLLTTADFYTVRMQKTINQRLVDFIASKKQSVNSFSKLMGIPQGTLNQQANGTARVSVDTLAAIATKYPDADMRWFLTGEKGTENAEPTLISSEQADTNTLLDIICRLQEENASLIRLLSNK